MFLLGAVMSFVGLITAGWGGYLITPHRSSGIVMIAFGAALSFLGGWYMRSRR